MSVERDQDPTADQALRARFAALRAADRVRAPGFDRMTAGALAPRAALAWAGALLGAGAIVAFALVLALGARPAPAPLPPVMFEVATEMPSDFLLGARTSDVRRDVPEVVPTHNDEVPFL